MWCQAFDILHLSINIHQCVIRKVVQFHGIWRLYWLHDLMSESPFFRKYTRLLACACSPKNEDQLYTVLVLAVPSIISMAVQYSLKTYPNSSHEMYGRFFIFDQQPKRHASITRTSGSAIGPQCHRGSNK